MKQKQQYSLSGITTHIWGCHYVLIYFGNTPFLSYNYGKDFYNAYLYVRELNRQGGAR